MSPAQQVCPVVGTTTSVLPPGHPDYDHNNPEARCPITNAKVSHHGDSIIHDHPSADAPPQAQDASACPALKNASRSGSVTDAICPVVGPVNAHLPPAHPHLTEKESGAVCPVTNATLEHHKAKVLEHPSVPDDAPVAKCPVINA